MDTIDIIKRIEIIEKILVDYRKSWLEGSPGWRRYVKSAADILKKEKEELEKQLVDTS